MAIQPFQTTTDGDLAGPEPAVAHRHQPQCARRYLLVRQRAGRNDYNFVDIENPVREQAVSLGENGLVVPRATRA